MLRNMLVLTPNGQILVDRSFDKEKKIDIEQDFIARFLIAIMQFGHETFNAPTQEIVFSRLKMSVKQASQIYLVGISDLDDDAKKLNELLCQISNELSYFNNLELTKPDMKSGFLLETVIDTYVKPYQSLFKQIPPMW